jgi:hypothetical protein
MVVEGANSQLEMPMKEGFVTVMVLRNLELESAPRFCASFMHVLTPFLGLTPTQMGTPHEGPPLTPYGTYTFPPLNPLMNAMH